MKITHLGLCLSFLIPVSLLGATIDMVSLIQEAKNLAGRIHNEADVKRAVEQLVREVPDKILAFIPSAIDTRSITQDVKTLIQERFGITLNSNEIAEFKKGITPSRVRAAIQSKIPDTMGAIDAVKLHLKNIDTAIYLINNVILPEIGQFVSDDLRKAMEDAGDFADKHSGEIQLVANELIKFCDEIKKGLASLQNLNDQQFTSRLLTMVNRIKSLAIPLFNNTIKPFVMQNQKRIFTDLMKFQNVGFTSIDIDKITAALQKLAPAH